MPPCAPPLRRVTFRRQRDLARGARASGWALGAGGWREAGVPREEAPGRKAGWGGGGAASPRAPRSPLRAGPRVAAGTAACLPVSPDSDLASPGWAGPERPREPR